MPRPFYESESDRQQEAATAEELIRVWRLDGMRKLKPSLIIDYAAIRNGRVVGFVELKHRNHAFGEFPTLYFSLSKLMQANLFKRVTGLPTMLVCKWSDSKMRYIHLEETLPEYVEINGRMDRGDEADMEPVANVAIRNFKSIC